MARPERKFTEDEIDEIEKLSPSLTQQQLADYFSISINTLKEIMKRDQRVSDSYSRGLTRAGILMIDKLYDKAMEGDYQSMKLWLSQRMGWTEKSRQEITGADGGPVDVDQDVNVTITVIGADD
tara:strand:+ start:1161 stop:1532 length:372 start_codon:yes stop_codon:yes gene_type:complete